jgi:nicotinamide-nucleotide amidase
MDETQLLDNLSTLLIKNKFTIATAESCTGGLIAHSLTNISGSSTYFERGIVSYSNQAKQDLLSVPKQLLVDHGAVSEQVAKAMAEGVRVNSHVDIGLSTTGIAGPTGGSKDKPVGLVYIGLSTKEQTFAQKHIFSGDRIQNKQDFCHSALQLLYDHLIAL